MKKFKEILLLKNLKRVGNVAINRKYSKILKDANDLDDLILKIKEMETKFNDEDLQNAKIAAEQTFENVINTNVEVITVFDDNYPDKLNIMGKNKPPVLYVKGNIESLELPNIAIIGTRNPSQLSQEFEENLVKQIANSTDNVVVSGLALGCDKIAHKTTVDENKITIAVLPSFVDEITPASNKDLAEEILQKGGCLISEYEPGKKVYKSNFTNRDKIVAAFSDSTVVIECGVKSGTMHTVKAADKLKKQIYVYLPSEKPEDSFDGNEFILNEYANSIKLENIEDLNNNAKKEEGSLQTTLL